jgi:hypothetical protein
MCLVASIVIAASVVGCNPPAPANKSASKSDAGKTTAPTNADKKSEEEIKKAFEALLAAIKAKDVDKIWGLLAKDSQGDTEREAKAVKEAYAKLAEKDKPAYEKKVGLSAKELSEMTGKLYVKSNPFFTGETAEMPDSKFDKVMVTGESTAKVHYTEDEGKGGSEIRSVTREDGQWKFILPISKAVLK